MQLTWKVHRKELHIKTKWQNKTRFPFNRPYTMDGLGYAGHLGPLATTKTSTSICWLLAYSVHSGAGRGDSLSMLTEPDRLLTDPLGGQTNTKTLRLTLLTFCHYVEMLTVVDAMNELIIPGHYNNWCTKQSKVKDLQQWCLHNCIPILPNDTKQVNYRFGIFPQIPKADQEAPKQALEQRTGCRTKPTL